MTIVAQAIGVLSIPLLARIYRPEHFGVVNIFALSVGLVCVVSSWRFEHLIFTAESDGEARAMVRFCLQLGLASVVVFTPVLFVFSETVGRLLDLRGSLGALLLVPAAAALYAFSTAMQNFLQRREQIKISGGSEIANKSTYCACGLAFANWSNGGIALALAATLGYASKVAFLTAAYFRLRLRVTDKEDLPSYPLGALWRKHGRTASSLVLSFLLYAVNNAAPALFVASRYGSDVLGQFSLAITVTALFEAVAGNAIGKMYYQRAAAIRNEGGALIGLWRKTMVTLVQIAVPVFLAMGLLSPWSFPVVFGPQWNIAGDLAMVLSVSAFASFCTAPVGWTFAVVGIRWYAPAWHASRVLSLFGIFAVAIFLKCSIHIFALMLVVQSVLLYGVDFFAQWRFAATYRPATAGKLQLVKQSE
jgi:O-antigen/teichoic acid export membrane protein